MYYKKSKINRNTDINKTKAIDNGKKTFQPKRIN
jgi:hypothetical protein